MTLFKGQLVVVRGIRGRRVARGEVSYVDRHGAIIETSSGSFYMQTKRLNPAHCHNYGRYSIEPFSAAKLADLKSGR